MPTDPAPSTAVLEVEAEEVAPPVDPEAVGNDIGDFFDDLGRLARQGGRVAKKLGNLAKAAEGFVGPLSRPMGDKVK